MCLLHFAFLMKGACATRALRQRTAPCARWQVLVVLVHSTAVPTATDDATCLAVCGRVQTSAPRLLVPGLEMNLPQSPCHSAGAWHLGSMYTPLSFICAWLQFFLLLSCVCVWGGGGSPPGARLECQQLCFNGLTQIKGWMDLAPMVQHDEWVLFLEDDVAVHPSLAGVSSGVPVSTSLAPRFMYCVPLCFPLPLPRTTLR